MPIRMKATILVAMLVGAVAAGVTQRRPDPAEGDWRSPGRDPGAQRFSPLTQITRENVAKLEQAWAFDTGIQNLQVTPLVIDGLMYVTGGPKVFALEPDTGKMIWTFEAKGPVSRRGVAYWAGGPNVPARVFTGAGEGRMVALDAKSGSVVATFGDGGYVDLKTSIRGDVDGQFTLVTPPVIYRDIIITGGSNTEGEPAAGLYGDIRGWDARTGKLLWSFHTVPRAGEPGVETWDGDSWKNRSGTNAWTYMTVDEERGLVFAATGSPTSDFYGADRKGKNLYGNCLLALDAATGKLRWFQQLVHHDLWDWDLPAAPTLIDVTRNGRRIPAVAQITKMSTLFIFDRTNGQPIHGVEEMPVPQSDVPGEATWPTQPFPVKPAPLSRTTFDPAKDMYTLTPEHAAYCRDLWDKNKMYTKGIFTPAEPPGHDGDVPEHARRRQLERAFLRSGERRRVHQHHEPRAGRADGTAARQGRRARAVPAHVALGQRVCPVLESGDEDAVLRPSVRRVDRGRREPGRSALADAARHVRRAERARLRQDRLAEHRGIDRHRVGRDLHRRHDRPALPRLRRENGPAAVGDDARRERACHADDVHGQERAAIRGRRGERRRAAAVTARPADRRVRAATLHSGKKSSRVNFQLPRLRAHESTRATAGLARARRPATEPTSGGGQLPKTFLIDRL